MEVQQNLKDVIRKANTEATNKGTAVGISWVADPGEWQIYDLTKGLPEGHQAELICFAQGVVPLAVNMTAHEALLCAVKEALGELDKVTELTKEQRWLVSKSL